MKINKIITVTVLLVGAVTICASTTSYNSFEGQYKNLKVLPGNISSKDLQGIMVDDFEDGLGVTCDFCHSPAGNGHGLDFISDARPEKEIARAMMRMTIGINKKYFKYKKPMIGSSTLVITCTTCHRGEAFPDGSVDYNK